MKVVSLVVFIGLLSFVEIFFVPMPLVFIALLLWILFISQWQALFLSFLAGLLFDILLLQPIGTSSIVFLILLFLMILYKKKFQSNNIVFLFAATFLSVLAIKYIYIGVLTLSLPVTAGLVTMFLYRLFFVKESSYETRYWFS